MLPPTREKCWDVLGSKNIIDRKLRCMADVKKQNIRELFPACTKRFVEGWLRVIFILGILDHRFQIIQQQGYGWKLGTSTTKCHPSLPITCPWPRVFRRLEPLVAETRAPSSRMWLRRWPLPHAAVLRHPRMVSLNQRLAMKSHLPKGGGTTLKTRLLNKYDNIKVTILYLEMCMWTWKWKILHCQVVFSEEGNTIFQFHTYKLPLPSYFY